MSGAEAEHLRHHLTDGGWHDSCRWCQRRRVEGGTGLSGDAAIVESARSGPEMTP